MPVITVEAMPMSLEAKRELVQALTEQAARCMKLPRSLIYEFIKENPYDDIGVGGMLLSDKHQAKDTENLKIEPSTPAV